MSKGAAESAIVLRRLLRSDDGRLKLQAAKILLETGMKVREWVELAQQMEELQTEVEHLKQERENGNAWDRLAAAEATTGGAGAAMDAVARESDAAPSAAGETPEDEDNVEPLFG